MTDFLKFELYLKHYALCVECRSVINRMEEKQNSFELDLSIVKDEILNIKREQHQHNKVRYLT